MANIQQPPLSYEASETSNRPLVSSSLPPEVIQCLKNARFLHLATCDAQTPHVSLMNYTYLPSTPFSSTPTIIMTTNPASKKTHNLHSNPRVSLLVHDWVSHRPPTRAPDPTREGSPPPQATNSSLAALLLNMNTSAMSRISVTINGDAQIVDLRSEEERWCKDAHLQNNTFREHETAEQATMLNSSPTEVVGDGGRGYFIEDEDVRVVVVKIKDGRIADWKGGIQDWVISGQSDSANSRMVNGV